MNFRISLRTEFFLRHKFVLFQIRRDVTAARLTLVGREEQLCKLPLGWTFELSPTSGEFRVRPESGGVPELGAAAQHPPTSAEFVGNYRRLSASSELVVQPNSAELSRTQPNSAELSRTHANSAELSRTQLDELSRTNGVPSSGRNSQLNSAELS